MSIQYSFNPLIDDNNLFNKIYEIKKYIKMSTFIYQKEFCIFDIYNQLVIIKSCLVNDKSLLLKICPKNDQENINYKNIYVKTYPKIINSIFYFSDLYKPKNYNLSINDEKNYLTMFNSLDNYFHNIKIIKDKSINYNLNDKIIKRIIFYNLKKIN